MCAYTPTQPSKNTYDITEVDKGNDSKTWDDADYTWDDADMRWDTILEVPTKPSKNSDSITQPNKST